MLQPELHDDLLTLHIKLLKGTNKYRSVSVTNLFDLLASQFEKRRLTEEQWVQYRSFVGLKTTKNGALDDMMQEASKVLVPGVQYEQISLRHRVRSLPRWRNNSGAHSIFFV